MSPITIRMPSRLQRSWLLRRNSGRKSDKESPYKTPRVVEILDACLEKQVARDPTPFVSTTLELAPGAQKMLNVWKDKNYPTV